MSDVEPWPYDAIELTASTIVVTKSRPRGYNAKGEQHFDALPTSLRPDETPSLATLAAEKALLTELHLKPADMYCAVVVGGAEVAFTDDLAGLTLETTANGYHNIEDVDAIFGYADTVKACRLGDCGLLVAEGVAKNGRAFNGFIHTTRLNLQGDTQFSDPEHGPCGGVELMLRKLQAKYQPAELRLTLVAGITKQFYIHDFTPTPNELTQHPSLTIAGKRDQAFAGWYQQGWLTPYEIAGAWDGSSYQADMLAAVRWQVKQVGLLDVYDDQHVVLNGDPASGHASHRAAQRGLVAETRDLYLVIPKTY